MITIVGAGKFGQAVSKLLGKNKHQLVDVEPDGTYSATTVEKIKQADNLVICVPSPALNDCINMISGIIKPDARILSCVKGLYEGLKTPTELIREQLKNPVATLVGPNLSVEIMLERPTMAVIAGDDAKEWTQLFNSKTFATVAEKDAVGAEFGGAIKNVVALGTGLFDGYYGDNACNSMGSFVAFALREIAHLYQHKSNSQIPELSFIGDLFATCMSETSRNHHFGHVFGEAMRKNQPLPKPEGTVEGYRTLEMVHNYAEQRKINLPSINALYSVFYKGGKVESIVDNWR